MTLDSIFVYDLDMTNGDKAKALTNVSNKKPQALVIPLKNGRRLVHLQGGMESKDAGGTFSEGEHIFDLPIYPQQKMRFTIRKCTNAAGLVVRDDNALGAKVGYIEVNGASTGGRVTIHGVPISAAANAAAILLDGVSFFI